MNDLNFIYVLDDPYIHMAIARNFSQLGVWALNGQEFVSATSSPLWTLFISVVFFFTGPAAMIPFLLNILFGLLSVYTVYKLLVSFGIVRYMPLALIVFAAASPLPALAFTGMEHSAQVFFAIVFVFLASGIISGDKTAVYLPLLMLIAAFLTVLRYEDIFLVFSVSAVFILRKKYVYALMICISGLAPVVLYGLISESHGWMFMPNPILIKSRIGELNIIEVIKMPLRAVKKMTELDIVFLLPAIIYVFYRNRRIKILEWNKKQTMFFIFLSGYILHMLFAQTGWFFRYEAYLVSLGIVILWVNICSDLPVFISNRKWYVKTLIIIAAVSLCLRSLSPLMVPQAANNIYTQHFQMQRLVNTLPQGTVIAANDIGMLNYYTSNYIVDLWGLADTTTAKLRLAGNYNSSSIDSLVKQKNVKLVIVYKEWFGQFGGLPKHWQKTGEWKMSTINIVNGNETVSFYTIDSINSEFYKQKLETFTESLPKTETYKLY